MERQVSKVQGENQNPNSLYIVFKYVVVGTGILGIGFLIAILGFVLTQK